MNGERSMRRIFELATDEVFAVMAEEIGEDLTVERLNAGFCDLWSHAVIRLSGREESDEFHECDDPDEADYPAHSWIFHHGRHHDAECFDGVENYHDLPIFTRHRDARTRP